MVLLWASDMALWTLYFVIVIVVIVVAWILLCCWIVVLAFLPGVPFSSSSSASKVSDLGVFRIFERRMSWWS